MCFRLESRFHSPSFRLQLQSPGHYSPLEAFYEDKRAVLPPDGGDAVTFPPGVWGSAINHSMHPEMKVSDPWRVVFAVTPPPPVCCRRLSSCRSPTRPAACRSSPASSGSRSWCCGSWLSCADASSSSLLPLWAWSATEVHRGFSSQRFELWGRVKS